MIEGVQAPEYIMFTLTYEDGNECVHCAAAKKKYATEISKGRILVINLVRDSEEYNNWVLNGIDSFPTLMSIKDMTKVPGKEQFSVCEIDLNDPSKEVSCTVIDGKVSDMFDIVSDGGDTDVEKPRDTPTDKKGDN